MAGGGDRLEDGAVKDADLLRAGGRKDGVAVRGCSAVKLPCRADQRAGVAAYADGDERHIAIGCRRLLRVGIVRGRSVDCHHVGAKGRKHQPPIPQGGRPSELGLQAEQRRTELQAGERGAHPDAPVPAARHLEDSDLVRVVRRKHDRPPVVGGRGAVELGSRAPDAHDALEGVERDPELADAVGVVRREHDHVPSGRGRALEFVVLVEWVEDAADVDGCEVARPHVVDADGVGVVRREDHYQPIARGRRARKPRSLAGLQQRAADVHLPEPRASGACACACACMCMCMCMRLPSTCRSVSLGTS